MTTDTESVALLAEALGEVSISQSDAWAEDAIGDHTFARVILDASPVLARRLAFATAWEMAEAALPEGWFLKSITNWPDDPQWMAQAMATGGRSLDDFRHGAGPTPTDALVALAEALRARAAA